MANLSLFDRRRRRVRTALRARASGKPRLSVHRSGRHIYAQVIDDAACTTLASASTLDKDLKGKTDATEDAGAQGGKPVSELPGGGGGRGRGGGDRGGGRGRGDDRRGARGGDDDGGEELIEKLVHINRVSKTVKGGKRFGFAALVVVGDGKGRAGFGHGKAREVPEAISKATAAAKKAMLRVPLRDGRTLHHDGLGHFGAGRVYVRSAPAGTGIIAR